MQRFMELNRYQKCILILTLGIALFFSIIYPITIAKVGYPYKGEILIRTQKDGSTIYSGKIKGKLARFTVSENQTVVFQYGKTTYTPYVLKEDPAAVPADKLYKNIIGVELSQGRQTLFRGGIVDTGDSFLLFNADGSFYNPIEITIIGSGGTEIYPNGSVKDSMAPSVQTVIELLNRPTLMHKGVTSVWFMAILLCALNVVSILFSEELFRWGLRFWVRNAEQAEPSDWEIASRYIGWTVLPLAALAFFLLGLQ